MDPETVVAKRTNIPEAGSEKKSNQIFIRNLSYDVTSDDLLQLFEVHGPVKNVSVVLENNVSRGFGFVKFALLEDAENAIKTLQGQDLKGRKLKLESAVKKARGKNAAKEIVSEDLEDTAAIVPCEEKVVETQKEIKETKVKISENEGTDKQNEKLPVGDKKADKKEKKKKVEKVKETEVAPKSEIIKKITAVVEDKKIVKVKPIKDAELAANVVPAVVATTAPSSSLKLLILGVPSDITKKTMQMVVSKIVKKATVEIIKSDHELYESVKVINPGGKSKTLLVTVPSRKDTVEIIEIFNNTTVHSLNLRQQQKVVDEMNILKRNNKKAISDDIEAEPTKEIKSKEKLIVRRLTEVTDTEYRRRKCRVIIRNLSFLATETNVSDKMMKFGPIVEASIPTVIVTKENNRQQNTEKENFEEEEEFKKENENGQPKISLKPNEKIRSRGFAFVTFLCESDAEAAVKGSSGLRVCNREVAVDFSMGKVVYMKVQDEKKGNETEIENNDMGVAQMEGDLNDEMDGEIENEKEMEVVEEYEDEDNENGENEDGDDDGEEGDENENEEGGDEDEEEEEEEEEVNTDDVDKGCTLFIRDLPFDAESKDLRAALRTYGNIKMAVIVKDPSSGMSRGSAFVKFDSPSCVQTCMQDVTLGSVKGIMVKDRVCRVDVAVDREQAQRLKQDNKVAVASDKRNMYLANEGLVVGKGEESAGMSEDDRSKRQKAQNEKRKKLINPLFFVSAHRLSIRNLAKSVTDNELKTLCIAALKTALAKNLVSKSDQDMHLKAQGLKITERTPESLNIPPTGKGCVKTAKIMLDLQKVRSGLPQSRGYGFVEFQHHTHALACLRELNNNPAHGKFATTVGKEKSRLIVEFCLENVRKVMVLKDRETRSNNFKEFKKQQADTNAEKKEKSDEKPIVNKKELNNTPQKIEKKEQKRLENKERVETKKRLRETEENSKADNENEGDMDFESNLSKVGSEVQKTKKVKKSDGQVSSDKMNEDVEGSKKQKVTKKRDRIEENENENDDVTIDESSTKKSKDERESEKAAKRKKMDLKRKEVEDIRLEKKLANIEKQKNGGRGPKIVLDNKDAPVEKKEKLANRFQKNKIKNSEVGGVESGVKKIKKAKNTTEENGDDEKREKKKGKDKGKGKGKGKKGDAAKDVPIVPQWGGFKRMRAMKKGK